MCLRNVTSLLTGSRSQDDQSHLQVFGLRNTYTKYEHFTLYKVKGMVKICAQTDIKKTDVLRHAFDKSIQGHSTAIHYVEHIEKNLSICQSYLRKIHFALFNSIHYVFWTNF